MVLSMIRTLTGKITAVHDLAVVMEVRGVGYLIGAPTANTAFKVDDELTLHTHLAVRETALDLYGFATLTELDLFELLLQVPKVGPKSALQILNQASPTLLIETISGNDATQLHKLSGIGKKTCENVVQYLHKKIGDFGFAETNEAPKLDGQMSDAIDALVSLGYDLGTARSVVSELPKDLSTNDIIKQALKQM
jgi:Holliday junction DNA helicase RuvA